MTKLDVTYIDEALAGWAKFKSTLPDLDALLERGDLMHKVHRAGKDSNDNSNNGRV